MYPRQCVSNDCTDCCGAARLQSEVLCSGIGDHNTTRMEWKMYEKIDTHKTRIAREDGHESKVYRWDFKTQSTVGDPTGTPIATFIDYFADDLWPEFVDHHDLACWQDFDWQQQKKNMPRGACVTVEDFPENFTHLFISNMSHNRLIGSKSNLACTCSLHNSTWIDDTFSCSF